MSCFVVRGASYDDVIIMAMQLFSVLSFSALAAYLFFCIFVVFSRLTE